MTGKPSFVINDSDQFVTIRLDGKPIATLHRARVLDKDQSWRCYDNNGVLVWIGVQIRRSEINKALGF